MKPKRCEDVSYKLHPSTAAHLLSLMQSYPRDHGKEQDMDMRETLKDRIAQIILKKADLTATWLHDGYGSQLPSASVSNADQLAETIMNEIEQNLRGDSPDPRFRKFPERS